MRAEISEFYSQFEMSPPDVYFNRMTGQYLIKQTGHPTIQDWASLPKTEVLDMLKDYGIRTTRVKGEDRSPGEEFLAAIRNNTTKSVDLAGPLGGYASGFHRTGSYNTLVTVGVKIPKAVKGDWSDIRLIIDGLFGPQAIYIYSYLALSRRQLILGLLRGMPVIIMVGPHNCGKSFFQSHVVTPLLGGRSANVSSNMTGEEKFTNLIYQNEHLIMGDTRLSTRPEDRRAFGCKVKELVATPEQTMRAIYTAPLQVETFQRLTISLNDEPENIKGLPIMDSSLEDKIMLFRVNPVQWPKLQEVSPGALEAYKRKVESQVNAFCWWLDNEFHIPQELMYGKDGKPARFCLAHYHDPSILRMLSEMSPEYSLLELIKVCYFTAPLMNVPSKLPSKVPANEICLTALELSQGLRSDSSPVRDDARRLLSDGGRIGTLLERLHLRHPDNVYTKRTAKNRFWVVKDVDSILSDGLT